MLFGINSLITTAILIVLPHKPLQTQTLPVHTFNAWTFFRGNQQQHLAYSSTFQQSPKVLF